MKKQYIVWGTGQGAVDFLEKFPDINIAYIVDGNTQKKGKLFHEYVISSPDDVNTWNDYYVVVASKDYYYEIKGALETRGLLEYQNFCAYDNLVQFYEEYELQSQIESFIEESSREIQKNSNIIIGAIPGYPKKQLRIFLDRLAGMNKTKQWVHFSESPYNNAQEMNFENIFVKEIPALFRKEQYKQGLSLKNTITVNCDAIGDSACIMNNNLGIGLEDEYKTVCYMAYEFYMNIFKNIEPGCVYIWNENIGLHKVIAAVCKELAITVIYMENGILPGTLMFDKLGQMGASYPAVYHEEFSKIKMDEADKKRAEKIIHYLNKTGLNRYKQNASGIIEKINQFIDKNKKTILLCGQIDSYSGIIPYNETAKKYHSPMFGSTKECVSYIKKLAKRNGWNVIYKAHPFSKEKPYENELGFLYLKQGDINLLIDYSDVTITINSSVSYLSLIRNKPVVMLGYVQFRGQQCAYEAFEIEKIESTIKQALEDGYTDKMKASFLEHVARIDKSYLWDDLSEKEIVIGKRLEHVTEFDNIK